MDPSALIFVALAVAWAAYLIPQALEHHEEGTRSRSIDKFSHRLRILARREPLSRRRSALVTIADQPEPKPPAPTYVAVPPTLTQLRARRRAAAVAARRRRRVLDLLLVANLCVGAAAILGRLAWTWQGVPAGLVLLWLVVCRVLKVREVRALTAPVLRRVDLDLDLAGPSADATGSGHTGLSHALDIDALLDEVDDRTQDLPAVLAEDETSRPGSWEMLPFVIPTYVDKDQARRTVRTIDLDSTGVWSSGRNAADSALVRESQESAPLEQVDEEQRATGS